MKMASTDNPEVPPQAGVGTGDDVMAPPREALINTAVKFLQNPKVRQSPLATRRAFLKKKGLTDDEVQLAIQRSGSTEEVLPLTPVGLPQPVHAAQLVPVPHSPAGYRWRDYGALTIIMVGIAVGFHQLYKKYILPLIMGSREDKKHLQRMENNIAAMSGTLTQTVSQLQQTLVSIQELLVQQQQKIQELSRELSAAERTGAVAPPAEPASLGFCNVKGDAARWPAASSTSRILDNQTVGELKAEIASLKSLLLGRKQFPSTPNLPKIPSWQIPLKTASAPDSPSANSSSDISPVSNGSASSSPVKDGHQGDAMGGPDGAPVVNGDGAAPGLVAALDPKDRVRMEVQGGEEEEEDVGCGKEEEEEDGPSMPDRRGGDGQINEQVDKLRRPEGASSECEVD